jgi:Na+/proline symporter
MLDWWIVGIFLLITLLVGIWQGRGMTNLSTFSIAGKNYSTAVLVATITATFLDGSAVLGLPENTFKYGMIFFFVSLGDIFYTLIQARFIAPNIDKFDGCISVGDMIEKSYGKKAKLFTGVSGTLMYITALGAQISAIGYIFHYFLGMSHSLGVFIGYGIIIIYSTWGGMKAVTMTDVIQFIVLIVAVPIICNMGLSKIGGYSQLFTKLPSTHLEIISHDKTILIKSIEVFFIFLLTLTGPATVQRLLMAKNGKQASQAFYYAAFIYIGFFSLVCITGLTAKILKPDLDPVLALPYIIGLLPIGLKGFAIAGLIAIVMSTADSFLNSASILLVNDTIMPLTKKELSNNTQLRIAQMATILIGSLSIIATFAFKSVFDIMMLSKLFWTPVIVIPFVTSVLGFAVDRKSFWVGALGAAIVVITWQIFKLEKVMIITSTLPGIIGNFIFFFGSHYYYKWFKPERFEPIPELTADEPIGGKKKSCLSNLRLTNVKKILLKLRNFSLVEFSYSKVKDFGASYQLFGIFTILNYILFTDSQYSTFLLFVKLFSGILCVGLFFAPELTKKYNKYFPLYWHFTLMIALPFISCSMIILHNGSFYWLLNMSLSILALALLVDSISFIGIVLTGLILSCITVRLYMGGLSFHPTGYEILVGLYLILSSIIFGTFFSRKREDFIEEKLQALQAMGGTIAHELRTPLGSVNLYSQMVDNFGEKFLQSYQVIQGLTKDNSSVLSEIEESQAKIQMMKESSQRIRKTTHSASLVIDMILANIKDPSQETHKAVYSIKDLVESAIANYPLENHQRNWIKLHLEDDFEFFGNDIAFSHIIYNLLKNSIYYIRQACKGQIIISTEKSASYNKLYFRDTGTGIPAERLPHMFEKFYTKTKHGTGLGLAFCKQVMEGLGGKISCHSVYGEYIEFILEFPTKLPV